MHSSPETVDVVIDSWPLASAYVFNVIRYMIVHSKQVDTIQHPLRFRGTV